MNGLASEKAKERMDKLINDLVTERLVKWTIQRSREGIVQWRSCRLMYQGIKVRVAVGKTGFFLLRHVQTHCRAAHPPIQASFTESETAGAWSWHLTSVLCRGLNALKLYLCSAIRFYCMTLCTAQGLSVPVLVYWRNERIWVSELQNVMYVFDVSFLSPSY